MNLSKKTLKRLHYLASMVPEYPAACLQTCCMCYDEGECCGDYESELWCPYEIFKPEVFQGNYMFEIETMFEPHFKDWKRVPDPRYRRCIRHYRRIFGKRRKDRKKSRCSHGA